MTVVDDRVRCAYVFPSKHRCSNSPAQFSTFCRTHADRPTVRAYRDAVAARLERALAADPAIEPISHRIDEYRACIAELDDWIAGDVSP